MEGGSSEFADAADESREGVEVWEEVDLPGTRHGSDADRWASEVACTPGQGGFSR